MSIGAMCTRLSVQIKFTEIESMLFSSIFPWRILVLDKEEDVGGFSPPPSICFCYIAYTVFYHVLSINVVGLFNVILLRLVIHLPKHLDDYAYVNYQIPTALHVLLETFTSKK